MDSIKRIREDSNLKLRIRVRSGPRIRANSGRILNSSEFVRIQTCIPMWDIALHMGSRLSSAPCRRFPHHPRPLPPLLARPTCVVLWADLRLLFHIFSPAI